MDGQLLSDADLGLSYPPTADTDTGAQPGELTVHLARRPAPTPVSAAAPQATAAPSADAAPSQAAVSGAPPPAAAPPTEKLLSDEDLGIAPHQVGPLSNASDDGWLSGAAKGTGTAAVKAVGNSAGFVGGLGNFADYLLARAEHAITGKPVDTILADLAQKKEAMQRGTGLPSWFDARNVMPAPADISGPILKRTGEYVPTSEPGKLAQAGAEAAMSMVGPGAGARVGTYGQVLKGAAAAAPGAFAGGAAAQGATDITGDPLLGMAAGLGVGAGAQGAAAAGKGLLKPAVMGVPGIDRVPVIGPRVAAARDNAAANALLSRSADPAAFREWAGQPAAPAEIPGSPQTTAAAVGTDRGLFQAEKDARNVDNAPFNAVDRAQSGAQQDALRSVQPEGDVFRPGQVIRGHLDAIDAAAEEAQARLEAAHQAAVAGRQAADQQATDRMTVAFRDAHDRAAQAATDAAAPLQTLPAPEVTGATLRTAQQEATDAANQVRSGLYKAVDPDGTLATVVTPLKEAKDRITAAIDPHAGVQPSGAEAAIHHDIDRMPDVVPFKSLQKLDSRVMAAMSDARRNPNANDPEAIVRLTQLKSAVMDAIHNGVENQAAHEQQLVASGLLSPEETIDARLHQFVGSFFERQQEGRLAVNARRADGVSGRGSAPGAGVERAERPVSKRPGDGSGDQGTPPPPGSRPDQSQVGGNLGYEAPAFGARTVSARIHAPETAAALGQDVPGTAVRSFGGPLDARQPAGQSGIVAYHGSPYDFERFDSAHIGRGDGRQVQGSGINATSSKDLAETYAKSTTENNARSVNHGVLKVDGKFVQPDFEDPRYMAADALMRHGGDVSKAISNLRGGMRADIPEAQEGARMLEAGEVRSAEKPTPNVYQVRIAKHPATFLDWDKPFSEQTPFVQAAIKRAGIGPGDGENPLGSEIYAKGSREPEELADIHAENRGFSKRLSDAGISGVSYADSHKNYGGAKAGSVYDDARNYVVFNDHDIHVTHKNGVPLARPVELPKFLMGQARGAWGTELKASGVRGDSFSPDLTQRAMRLVGEGRHLDHGVAYGAAFGDKYAGVSRELSGEGGAASRVGQGAPGASDGAAGDGLGRGQSREGGGAPSQDLRPNIDAAAEGRLNAAKAANAAYQQTHKNPTVLGALETNGFAGQYKMPNSAIPAQWVRSGDKGYETARAFLAASNNDPRAVAAMQDASLAQLRKSVPPIGNLHPNALARWKEQYAGANRALDEVSPGFSSRFDNAATATQSLLDLGVEQKHALDDFQKQLAARTIAANSASAVATRDTIARARGMVRDAYASPAGKFVGQGGDRIVPAEVENAVGSMLKTGRDGAAKMRSLVGSVSSDPEALAGLRKAGVDWMLRSFSNVDGTMSGAGFIKFVRDNRDVLGELYPKAQVSMFGAIAADLEHNARWRTMTAIKGGSDTAKNMQPMLEKAVDDTKRHISIGAAATAGFLAGGPKGALGGAGLYLLNSLRSAGIRGVQDLYREALLDPEKARYLISKMPEVPEGGKLRALTGLVRKGLILGEQQTRPQ